MRFFGNKIFSWLAVFFFLASGNSFVYAEPPRDSSPVIQVPAAEAGAQAPNPQNQTIMSASGQVAVGAAPDSSRFVAQEQTVEDEAQRLAGEEANQNREEVRQTQFELDRYSFEEALDLFRPEFATAVLLEGISEENIKTLTELPFEVGLAILHGELVMFSSGNESEVKILRPVELLLQEAELIAHSHPQNHAITEPSGEDMQAAGSLTEYVVSPEGVYAYNHDGLKNQHRPYSHEFFVQEISKKLERAKAAGLANQILVREKLNEFIYQMDRYNEASESERILFRSGAVLAPAQNLNRSNVTSLQFAPPDVILTGGSVGSMRQPSGSSVHGDFNLVRAAGAYFGITLNYDDFGKTPTFRESKNLSGLQTLNLMVRSTAHQVKVEFMDADGDKNTFLLTGIDNGTDRVFSINMQDARQWPINFDKGRVSAISVIVDRGGLSGTFSGTLDLTLDGLNVTGNQVADPSLNASHVTPFPGSASPLLIVKDAPNSVLAQPVANRLELDYHLANDNAFATAYLNYDNGATAVVESENFLGRFPNNEMIVGIQGPAGSNLRIEFEDARSTLANPIKDFLNLGPLNGSLQFFRVKLDNLAGINLGAIKGVSFSVDRWTADPAQGTARRDGHISLLLGTGLNVTGSQLPDPTLTAAELTAFPAGGAPLLVRKDAPASVMAQPRSDLIEMDYHLTTDDAFTAAYINYDNGATATVVESADFSQFPNNEMIVGVNGPAGSYLRIEFEDARSTLASPRKDSLLLGPLSGAQQFFRVKLSNLDTTSPDGINLSALKGVAFSVDRWTVDPAAGLTGRDGRVTLTLGAGLDVTGAQVADPTLTAAQITSFPGSPSALRIVKNASDSVLAQPEAGELDLEYRLSTTTDDTFATAYLNYDDGSTTTVVESADFTQFANNEMIVGVEGVAGTYLKIEFEDARSTLTNPIKDSLLLGPLNGGLQFFRVKLANLDTDPQTGINLNAIKGVAFSVDRWTADPINGSVGRDGRVRVFVGPGLDVTGAQVADPALTAAELTLFPSGGAPLLVRKDAPASVMAQPRSDLIEMDYHLTTNDAFTAAYINYDNGATANIVESADFSQFPNNEMIVGVNGPAGAMLRIEFEDARSTLASPRKDSLLLGPLNGAQQFFRVKLSNLDTTSPDGISLSALKGVAFSMDRWTVDPAAGLTGRDGRVTLTLGAGLDVTGAQVYDPSLNINHVTSFPGNPSPLLIVKNVQTTPGTVLSQPNPETLKLEYHLSTTTDDTFAAAYVNYDNPSTTTVVESADFTHFAGNQMIISVNGPAGSYLKIEFEDASSTLTNPVKDYLLLGPLNGRDQIFRVFLANLNMNLTAIKGVAFSVDRWTVDPVNGTADRDGEITLRVGPGLNVTGSQLPAPALTAADITEVPGLPGRQAGPVVIHSASALATLTQESRELARMTYDVTPVLTQVGNPPQNQLEHQFAALLVNYDDFGTDDQDSATITDVERRDLSQLLGNIFTFGLAGAPGMDVRVTFEDVNGNKDFFNLGRVGAAEQIYSLDLSLLDTRQDATPLVGVDMTVIRSVNFEVAGYLAANPVMGGGPYTGELLLHLKNMDVTGAQEFDPALTAGALTQLPGSPSPVMLGGSSIQSSVVQQNRDVVTLNYNVIPLVTPQGTQRQYSGVMYTYDDYATPAVSEFQNIGTDHLTVGLSGTPGTSVRVVFEDALGGKDSLVVEPVSASEQLVDLDLNLLDGIDRTQITGIGFVVDAFLTSALTGEIHIHLPNVNVTGNILPEPGLTAANISTLPGLPGLQAGPVLIQSADAAAEVLQSLRDEATLNYDVTPTMIQQGTPPAPVAVHQFALAAVKYDDYTTQAKESRDLSGEDLIVGLTGTPGMNVRVIFEDASGGSDFLNLGGLDGTEQYFRLTRSFLDNVNLAEITAVGFQVSGTQTPNSAGPYSGTLKIHLNNMDVTGAGIADPNLNVGHVSQLPGDPEPVFIKSAVATGNLAQLSRDRVRLTYDVTPVVAAGNPPVVTHQFAEAFFTYDDFGTPQKEFINFTAGEIVVGLTGTPGMNVSVLFEDSAGVKDSLNLGRISGAEQFYRLELDLLDQVNRSELVGIGFLVSGTQAENPVAGGGPYQGELNIRLSGLDPTAFIPPDSSIVAAQVSDMPNHPSVFTTGGSGTAAVNQISASETELEYDVSVPTTYSGMTVSYDDPITSAVEFDSLAPLGGHLILGLEGPAGSNVRVEFIDSGGARDFLNVGPMNTAVQFYDLDLSFLNVDVSEIASINFVVTQALVPSAQGIITVTLGNLNFLGSGFLQPDPSLDLAQVMAVSVPGTPEVLLTGGSGAGSSVAQISSSRVDLFYNVTAPGSWAGVDGNYDSAGTPATEVGDWSNVSEMLFGLAAPAGTNVRVEFEDKSGARASQVFGSVTPTEQFYRLTVAQLTGINLAEITRFHFLVENTRTVDKQDVLYLRVNGLAFTNILSPDNTKNEGDLTPLGGAPDAVLLGGSSSNASIARYSDSRFDLSYDVTVPGTFSGGGANFNHFTTPADETQDLSALTHLVVGVRGNPGDSVRLQLEDNAGAKSSVILTGISDAEQFFNVPTALFSVDLSHVAAIYFIVDENLVGANQGVLRFRIDGLAAAALTAQEEAIRQGLIDTHLGFFQSGVGIDPATHLPFDSVTETGVPQRFTQPTSIGFYLQLLSDIANGKIISPSITRSEALSEASFVLDSLLSAQGNFGWNGLIPFLSLSPFGAGTSTVGLGDNANLAQSAASFIGGLESGNFSGADQTLANNLIAKANTVLSNMETGFQQMYDPFNGLFRAEVDRTNGQKPQLWLDRFSNEFRAAVAFVTLYYGINPSAFNNMSFITKSYTDALGNTVETFAPFDGGAFQMFWPLLRTNEERYIEMLPALRNFLYVSSDYSRQHNIPGLVSAASTPEDGYIGLIGAPELAEVNPQALAFDIGSVYALASAFAVEPSFVIRWLDSLRSQSPALSGQYGFFDSARSATEVGERYFAIDQASFILGLADTGADDFDAFMTNRGLKDDFEGLYENIFVNITPISPVAAFPAPPVVPARTFSVLNNFSSEGMMGTLANGTDTLVDNNGYNIRHEFMYSGQNTRAGHFYVLDQTHDAANESLILTYSATISPGEVEVELVDTTGAVVGVFPVAVTAGPGFREAVIQFPGTNAFRQIGQVNVLVNPQATGVTTADFNIHQLTFKFIGIPPAVISPNPALDASQVSSLPSRTVPEITAGSAPSTAVTYFATNQFRIDFNNTATGHYGGGTLTIGNFTPPAQGVDLSGLDDFVLGISGAGTSRAKVEIMDTNNLKAVFYVEGITLAEQFWELPLQSGGVPHPFLPAGFDLTSIIQIHVIQETAGQGNLNVRASGMIPISAPGAAGPVSTLPGVTGTGAAPVVGVTGSSAPGTTATVNTGTSPRQMNINYNVSQVGSYSGGSIFYENFGTPQTEEGDLTEGGTKTELKFGIRQSSGGSGTIRVRLELVDANGLRAVVFIDSVTANPSIHAIPFDQLPPNFDITSVTMLSYIIDQNGLSGGASQTGTLEITLDGIQ